MVELFKQVNESKRKVGTAHTEAFNRNKNPRSLPALHKTSRTRELISGRGCTPYFFFFSKGFSLRSFLVSRFLFPKI